MHSRFVISTVHGVSILGAQGSYLVLGPNGQLLSCESTYKAACDCVGRLSMMHLRWLHSAKYYAIRLRNWSQRKAVR